ncbi:hypothetical protein LZ023_28430 [Pseudomonas silvicola]|nr:hypothetical protein LZ023_28430 [Pseudomonas silvicola]
MHTRALPFFLPKNLELRYRQDALTALQARAITPNDYVGLGELQSTTSGLRVDIPSLSNGTALCPRLATALVLSHRDQESRQVFLWTILDGLQRFADRVALHDSLNRLSGLKGNDVPDFELTLVEPAQVFEQTAQRYVRQRALTLTQTSDWLDQVPNLEQRLSAEVTERLAPLFPHKPATADHHWIQVRDQDTETVHHAQNLTRTLVQQFAAEPLPDGHEYHWLDLDGRPLEGEVLTAMTTLMQESLTALAPGYRQALERHWQGQTPTVARVLEEGFYQSLLQARANEIITQAHFDWVREAVEQVPGKGQYACSLTLVGGEGPNTLSIAVHGCLLITHPTWPDRFVYDGNGHLQRFFNEEALWQQLQAVGNVSPAIALADQARWSELSTPTLVTLPVGSTPFLACAKAIQTLQALNLAHSLAHPPSASAATAIVKVDQALDIRANLDIRLDKCGQQQRWNNHPTQIPTPSPNTLDNSSTAQALRQAEALGRELEAVHQRQPGLNTCVQTLLNPSLVVFEPHLDANSVYVSLVAAQPNLEAFERKVSLGQLLPEWLSLPMGALPDDRSRVVDKDGGTFHGLPWSVLTTVLSDAAPRLLAHHRRMLESQNGWRSASQWQSPQPAIVEIQDRALRLEWTLEQESSLLDATLLAKLKQALNMPVARQRYSQGPAHAVVHGLTVKIVKNRAAARLSNVIVVHAANQPNGKVLLWSTVYGLQVFPNLASLTHWVVSNLISPARREPWLALLPPGDRILLLQQLALEYPPVMTCKPWRIEGHWLEETQRIELQRQQLCADEARKLAVRCHFSGTLFQRLVDYASSYDTLRWGMRGLNISLEVKHLEATLPGWIARSTPLQLAEYMVLLRRSLAVEQPSNDYLFGLQDLHLFAKVKLQARLKTLIPVDTPDPDHIMVTLTQFTPAVPPTGDNLPVPALTVNVNETLTRCTVDQLTTVQTPVLSLTMTDGSAVPAQLRAEDIRGMIRELDIATQYQTYLAEHFSRTDPQYAERRERFGNVCAPQLAQVAFQQQLDGTLSREACAFVRAVVEMPDALARLQTQGKEVVIRPLQLLGSEGAQPDIVAGMHLIGPVDMNQGPLVLYTVNAPKLTFQAFKHRADLLEQVLASDSLQAQIVARLPEEARSRYRNGGFVNPHFPILGGSPFDIPLVRPLAVTFQAPAEQGNTLHYLFDDVIALMQLLARDHTVTTSEADRRAFVQLLTLGTELGSLFLPKALTTLVNLWQSKDWLVSSLSAAAGHRWGEALARLSASLFLLLGSRSAQHASAAGQPVSARWRGAPERAGVPGTRESEVATHLVSYEVPGLELRSMTKDPARHLFLKDARCFAIMHGRVYEVEPFEGAWRIIEGERKGPRIHWSDKLQWQPSGGENMRIGGSTTREAELVFIEADLEGILTVDARGMPSIRAKDTLHASMIEEAHRQAHTYLSNALENLNAKQQWQPLPARTESIIRQFFGVSASSTTLLHKLRTQLEQIITELLDPSLAPETSMRFVVGRNAPTRTETLALTFPNDPQHDIYLTETFFTIDPDLIRQTDPGKGFNLYSHYQASTLIHELAHIANKAKDIAYLAAYRPFEDVYYNRNPVDEAAIKALVAPRSGLSLRAQRSELFTVVDPVTSTVRDLGKDEPEALKKVLSLSKTKRLDTARDIFLTDPEVRANIILANADSIALLVTLLGRERFEAPAG